VRLAKRHASLTLRSLRDASVAAQGLVGAMAGAAGIGDGRPADPAALAARFDMARISREPWVADEREILRTARV
jgi:hypothetical protein